VKLNTFINSLFVKEFNIFGTDRIGYMQERNYINKKYNTPLCSAITMNNPIGGGSKMKSFLTTPNITPTQPLTTPTITTFLGGSGSSLLSVYYGKKVIDEYNLFSSNCTTHTCDWLIEAGTKIFNENISGYEYKEDFVIPNSLQNYLNDEIKQGGKPLTIANDEIKQIINGKNSKQTMQGAGFIANTSGSSGQSSGKFANSTSSGSLYGRNTSKGSSVGSSLGSSSSGLSGASSGSLFGSSSGNGHSSSSNLPNNRKR